MRVVRRVSSLLFRPVLQSDDPPSDERVGVLDSGQLTVEGHVFDVSFSLTESVSQQQLYTTSIEPLIQLLLQGYNVAVVAFGQSGAGKSYTLVGPDTLFAMSEMDFGIIPRSVRHIFSHLHSVQRSNDVCEYAMSVNVSYLEINDEEIIDLLSYDHDVRQPLSVQTNEQGGVSIPGLSKLECCSVPQVLGCLASPLINSASSVQPTNHPPSTSGTPSLPSHTVFSLHVQQQWCDDVSSHSSFGTVHFVDLCGSELRSVADDPEDFTIDAGLLTLREVADALSYGGRDVPYGAHPLTSVLREVFGGNCKTMFLCCIAPADTDESLNALQYTNHVRAVSNWVHPNLTSCPLRSPSMPVPPAPVAGAQVPLAPVCAPRLVNPVPPFQHQVQAPMAPSTDPAWVPGVGAFTEEQQYRSVVTGDGAGNVSLIRQMQQAVSSPPLTELSGQRAALHESLLADLYQRIQLLELRQLTAASTAAKAGARKPDAAASCTDNQDRKQESDKEETLFQLQFAAEQYRQLVLSAEQLLKELAIVPKPGTSTKTTTATSVGTKSNRNPCTITASAAKSTTLTTTSNGSSNSRSQECSRIQEWLYRKQETDACLMAQSKLLEVASGEGGSCSLSRSGSSADAVSSDSGEATYQQDGIIVASTPLLSENRISAQTVDSVKEPMSESRDCSVSSPPMSRVEAGGGGSGGRRRRQACTEHDLRLLRDSDEVKILREYADYAQTTVNEPAEHISRLNDPADNISRVNNLTDHHSPINDPVLSSLTNQQDEMCESDGAAVKRQIEKLRQCREQLHSQRHDVSLQCRDGSLDSVTIRRLLQLDEAVHAVDDVIEQKNLQLLNKSQPVLEVLAEAAHVPVQLLKLVPGQLAALYCRCFNRLVDCRINGREKDIIVAELDAQVDGQNSCLKQLRRMVDDLLRERAHYKRQRDQLRSQLQLNCPPSRQLPAPHRQLPPTSTALQRHLRYDSATVVDASSAQMATPAIAASLRNNREGAPVGSQRTHLHQRLMRGVASSHTSPPSQSFPATPAPPTQLSCQQGGQQGSAAVAGGGFSRVTRQQGGRVVIEAAALPTLTSTERRYRR